MSRSINVLVCIAVLAVAGCGPEATTVPTARQPDAAGTAIPVAAAPAAQVPAVAAMPVPPAGSTTAALAGPYEDPAQTVVPFGRRTWWLAPWRGYMDTWPAARFLDCVGITVNADGAEGAAAAEVLGAAGFRHARIEWGWGNMAWDGRTLANAADRQAQVAYLKRNGLRPLILLNAHHGGPCPMRNHRVQLTADAAVGAREVFLADTHELRAGYTGFRDQGDYIAGYPLIERIDAASGRCELSAPLKKAEKAGPLELVELRYRPFSGSVNADGSPNPASAETVQGWMDYVAAVCATARAGLGTGSAADAGFDLEVWNEYTFGSNFLDIANYCDPKPEFKDPIIYRAHGREATGCEAILPMTVDWAAANCPGARVISGFANQRPWDNGTVMWPGQAGISRHYYTGLDERRFDAEHMLYPNSGPLDARGKPDGTSDGKDWHTVIPGSFFVPEHNVAMPEWWFYAYQTEFITRDVQPWPSAGFSQHFRYANPGTGRPAEVWNTETNLYRAQFAATVAKAAGCGIGDPRLHVLMHQMGARGILRQLLFSAHKGVTAMTVFACKAGDTELGVIPDAFYDLLKQDGGRLTDRVRAAAGPQVAVVGRVVRFLAAGAAIDVARKLTLDRLVEHDPRLVFTGDGSAGHPDRWNRDDFACLPFQLAPDRFAIGYYVVTRDMAQVRDGSKDPLDIARYCMAPQTFDLTLGNLRGTGATVAAWDPLNDSSVPVEILACTATSLTVRVSSLDTPRFLTVTETAAGPLPVVHVDRGAGGAEVVVEGNVPGTATITWGPWPQRSPATLVGDWAPGNALGEYFQGPGLEGLRLRRMEPGLALTWSGPGLDGWACENVSARWTCRIIPPATGTYTFTSSTDDGQRLWVDGRQLVDDWKPHGPQAQSGSIDLVAGKAVSLRWEWFQGGGGYAASLTWTPPGGGPGPIPAGAVLPPVDANPYADRAPVVRQVTPGQPLRIPLTGAGDQDAVQVAYRADGLVARWPQWPCDVRGVLGFSSGPAATAVADDGLPALDTAATGCAPAAPWQGSDGHFTASSDGITATLDRLGGAPAQALPAISTLDHRAVTATSWSGVPAWSVDDVLDPVAHPGATRLARRLLVCRIGGGCLLLTVEAADAVALAAAAPAIARLATAATLAR